MRYYYSSELGIHVEDIDNIIQKYEELCKVTCELCGAEGKMTKGGKWSRWYKTLCEKCMKELNFEEVEES